MITKYETKPNRLSVCHRDDTPVEEEAVMRVSLATDRTNGYVDTPVNSLDSATWPSIIAAGLVVCEIYCQITPANPESHHYTRNTGDMLLSCC
ncbi:hypothetical protein J6590_043362 [Homalodisca vitripennis]|nr:hypothetical protein J6590_043362 [Homalodisca vitripennis]